MLTVSDLAKEANATANVVRYYARIGLIQPVGQQDNGYRLFELKDAARLRFIRMAKLLGFTLQEIKEILDQAEHGQSPCSEVRTTLQKRIFENRARIVEMLALQERMERAVVEWENKPDGCPDGDTVCPLIESFVEKSI